jgi:hypothetical protein
MTAGNKVIKIQGIAIETHGRRSALLNSFRSARRKVPSTKIKTIADKNGLANAAKEGAASPAKTPNAKIAGPFERSAAGFNKV